MNPQEFLKELGDTAIHLTELLIVLGEAGAPAVITIKIQRIIATLFNYLNANRTITTVGLTQLEILRVAKELITQIEDHLELTYDEVD